jgi:hypothetical protein
MKWAFDYMEEEGIVTTKIAGLLNWESHKKFAEEMVSFARSHNSHKILIDFLELVPILTTLEVDDLPKVLIDAGLGPEDILAAVHDATSPRFRDFEFFKNVANIKSIRVQIFSNKNDAVTWLKTQ